MRSRQLGNLPKHRKLQSRRNSWGIVGGWDKVDIKMRVKLQKKLGHWSEHFQAKIAIISGKSLSSLRVNCKEESEDVI